MPSRTKKRVRKTTRKSTKKVSRKKVTKRTTKKKVTKKSSKKAVKKTKSRKPKKAAKRKLKKTTKRKVKKTKKVSKPKKPTGILHVFSDFDNTIVRKNVAGMFVRHYILRNPHMEPFYRRWARALPLSTPEQRKKKFERYYECLRRIPAKKRNEMLRHIHVNGRWLNVIKDLRMRHRTKTIGVTIITRNCIDVVHEWVMQNRDFLARNHVVIEGIIANRPLDQRSPAIVKERADLKHIDYVGFGTLFNKHKKLFIDRHSIYIGDEEDENLVSLVHELIRV